MNSKFSEKQKETIKYIQSDCSNWMKIRVLGFVHNKVDIIDNEGYKYTLDLHVIKNARKRNLRLNRFFRNNIHTFENINNYLKIDNREIELTTINPSNAKEKLTWNCHFHGEFITCWNSIKSGGGCPICGKLSASLKRRNSYGYVSSVFNKHGYELVSREYINNLVPLEFLCKKHKKEGIQLSSFGNLITKNDICSFCNKERFRDKYMKSHEEFKEDLYNIHKFDYTVLEEYSGSRVKLNTKCNKCGHIWKIRASHLLGGHGCPQCAPMSIGEKTIEEFLINTGIFFQREYRINDCRYKKALPFDFAIFDDNEDVVFLIEYDGKQHFKPFGFGEKCSDKIEKSFRDIQKRDKIKDNYCKNNGIPLLNIPYWEYKEINNILHEWLNKYGLIDKL